MIRLENEYLCVEVSSHGAEVRRMYDKTKKKELMWNADSTFWNRVSPVLFPIVGQVYNKTYTIDGSDYHLPQHGFLRDQEFVMVRNDEKEVVFEFCSNHNFTDVYPYEHKVLIGYMLSGKKLTVSWEVVNCDEKEMWYSIGAHPAFMLDEEHSYEFRFNNKNDVTRYNLEGPFIKDTEVYSLQSMAVTEANFKNTTLIVDGTSSVELVNRDTEEGIRVEYEGFDYLGIWTPFNDKLERMAPFICIEPWIGMADRVGGYPDIREKRGIKSLGSKQNMVHQYTIEVL